MCGMDVPGQQLFDPVDGMVGDTGQHFAQIGFGIESIEFRRTDQAVDRRCPFSYGIRTRKQVVLPTQGHPAQRALRRVVVDLDVAIFWETPAPETPSDPPALLHYDVLLDRATAGRAWSSAPESEHQAIDNTNCPSVLDRFKRYHHSL
jgi:hypothetical protein